MTGTPRWLVSAIISSRATLSCATLYSKTVRFFLERNSFAWWQWGQVGSEYNFIFGMTIYSSLLHLYSYGCKSAVFFNQFQFSRADGADHDIALLSIFRQFKICVAQRTGYHLHIFISFHCDGR